MLISAGSLSHFACLVLLFLIHSSSLDNSFLSLNLLLLPAFLLIPQCLFFVLIYLFFLTARLLFLSFTKWRWTFDLSRVIGFEGRPRSLPAPRPFVFVTLRLLCNAFFQRNLPEETEVNLHTDGQRVTRLDA